MDKKNKYKKFSFFISHIFAYFAGKLFTEQYKHTIQTHSVFLFILLLCQISSAQSKNSIIVAEQTTIENEVIFLKDVSKISGKDSERLEKISLGYSPNIGMTREIPIQKLNLAIAAAGFAKSEILLKSPDTFQVKRKSQTINQIEIRKSVETAIFEQFKDSKVTAKIIRLEVPDFIETPIGEVLISVDISKVQNIFAAFYLPVTIRIGNKMYKRISAKVEIEAFANVYVSTTDLANNKRIKESDVELKNIRLEKPILSYLHKEEDIRGTKTVKDLPKGTVLTKDTYVPDIVVKSGDLVRIVGQSGKLQVVVNGEARASGRIGDRIAVKNLQSNRLIQATVFDEGLVKIYF